MSRFARTMGVLGAALAGFLAVPLTPAGPAAAAPAVSLAVGPPKATVGKLTFAVGGSGLTDPDALRTENLTLTVDETKLPVQVEPAGATPRGELPTRAVIVAVDTSAAMAGAPLAAVEVAVFEYIEALPAEVAVGLVAYSDAPQVVLAPTYDRGAFRSAVGSLTGRGGSALYDAATQAAGAFGTGYAQRRLLLIAGGADTRSTGKLPDATGALTRAEIPTDIVAYRRVDLAATLGPLATGTGGQAVSATSEADLKRSVPALAAKFSPSAVVTATVPASLSGRTVNATLTVTAGGQSATTSFAASFAVDEALAAPTQEVKANGLSLVVLGIAIGAIGLAVAVAVFVVTLLLLGRTAVQRRLHEIDRFGAGSGAAVAVAAEVKPEGNAFLRTALLISERAVQRQDRQSIEHALERAGMALRPAEWMLVRGVVTAVIAVLSVLAVPWFVGVPLGLIVGWFGTSKYLGFKAGRRARKFGDLLPEALQLVVGALRSGFSLLQAVDAVVREGPEPVASEFGRAMAEIRLGGELEDALERTAERNGSPDLSWLVMAIRIQREVGGNLSEVLETAVETMRERGRINRHVRALTAEGRLSAYVLIGMPVAVSGFLLMFRREYLSPMFHNPIGIAMLVGAVVMLSFGAFVISRMVKVEV